jgi:hypothetical protein
MQCVICHETIDSGRIEQSWFNCTHAEFHAHCIKRWIAVNSSCPYCRAHLRGKLELSLSSSQNGSSALMSSPPAMISFRSGGIPEFRSSEPMALRTYDLCQLAVSKNMQVRQHVPEAIRRQFYTYSGKDCMLSEPADCR